MLKLQFIHRLDLGDGREVDLKECPRSKLRRQHIKYLGPVCDRNCIYLSFMDAAREQ